jgi:DNA-binding beta-propeller fold protein YncE
LSARRLGIVGAAAGLTLLAGLGFVLTGPVTGERPADAPRFQVDAGWPKPLPRGWVMGQAAGVAVDRRDHVWVIQRPRTITAGTPAPPVLVFDADGKLLRSWGGPGAGYEWPLTEHGIFVDHQDHVWIAGSGQKDHQLLKFTADGKFLLQIGKAGVTGGDGDTAHLGSPANVSVDPAANEVFVADGYKNHRVIVFDAQTGAYKRHWGANGRPPGEPGVKPFANPVHCVRLAKDGLLYVCDRTNNRIQVFRKDGTFVKELVVAAATRGGGSTWDVDLSHDAPQTWLYDADGQNDHVWTLVRDDGRVVGQLGRNGHRPGEFRAVHNLAVDSKGNLYTTEVGQGKRVQKFVFKGVGAGG